MKITESSSPLMIFSLAWISIHCGLHSFLICENPWMCSFAHHLTHLLDSWNQKLSYPNYSIKIALWKTPTSYPLRNLSSTPMLNFWSAAEVSPSLVSRSPKLGLPGIVFSGSCVQLQWPFLFFKDGMLVPASGTLSLPFPLPNALPQIFNWPVSFYRLSLCSMSLS